MLIVLCKEFDLYLLGNVFTMNSPFLIYFFHKVWNLFRNSEMIKSMVSKKIQEESLRTYLFTYSGIYDSLNLQTLANMFQLEVMNVHSSISKMIINDELMVSVPSM